MSSDKRVAGVFSLLCGLSEKLCIAILAGGIIAPYLESREKNDAERMAFEKLTTPEMIDKFKDLGVAELSVTSYDSDWIIPAIALLAISLIFKWLEKTYE